MDNPFISIMLGSSSDHKLVERHLCILDDLGIPYEVKITSAHRTPHLTRDYVERAELRGCAVFVTIAGMANHLSGTVAALTLKPVIGVPVACGMMGGQDALLSTVQMPPGVPVACVSIDGAKNALLLAARIFAIHDPQLTKLLMTMKSKMVRAVVQQDVDYGTDEINL